MIRYTVVQGDTLSGVAARYGLSSWRIIYDHSSNADFRAKRPDPNLIYPGDQFWIPTAATAPSSDGLPERVTYKVQSIDTTVGIQRRLNNLGFDAGPEDDIYGPLTTEGVRRFQQFCKDNSNKGNPRIIDAGPVDGIAGPLTKAALGHCYGV